MKTAARIKAKAIKAMITSKIRDLPKCTTGDGFCEAVGGIYGCIIDDFGKH
jgi:hypothetical protein